MSNDNNSHMSNFYCFALTTTSYFISAMILLAVGIEIAKAKAATYRLGPELEIW